MLIAEISFSLFSCILTYKSHVNTQSTFNVKTEIILRYFESALYRLLFLPLNQVIKIRFITAMLIVLKLSTLLISEEKRVENSFK